MTSTTTQNSKSCPEHDRRAARAAIDRASIEFGPWFSDDAPESVLYDLRAAGAADGITLKDIADYLATRPRS